MLFKPAGVPTVQLSEIVLELDELEAIRLADLEGLYHEDAAQRMNISRQTFGRIVASARNKVARALVQGMSLRIEGGAVDIAVQRTFACADCHHEWRVSYGTGRPARCPQCGGLEIRRIEERSRWMA